MNPNLLRGKRVVGNDGYILGEIDDLHVNLSTWVATAFYINLSDDAVAELDFKKSFMHKIVICLPTDLIKTVGDVVTLNEPVRNLKDIAEKVMQPDPSQINGKKIVSQKGNVVGEVEGLDVDAANWQVTGLQVSLTDDAATEIGFKRPFISKVVVLIPTSAVNSVGNFVTLDKSVENLKSLVECIRSCQQSN